MIRYCGLRCVCLTFCCSFCSDLCCIYFRGQNPLHILGQYGKENAAAIFDLFHECMPNYPIDKPDANGNSGKWSTEIKSLHFSLGIIKTVVVAISYHNLILVLY